MEQKSRHCPGCKRENCISCKVFQKLNTNKNVPVSLPASFKPERQNGFGISFDLGSTTVSGMLWDLEKSVCLGGEAIANPQAKWGMDIISRLQYALQGEKELLALQKVVVQAMDGLAYQMVKEKLEETVLPGRVVVVGNTAMCQLLMGIMPEKLVRAPFSPDYSDIHFFRGTELGFRFLKEAEICVLPPIGGYVGADALAVYACIGMEDAKKHKKMLAVDIGTNGEILLLNKEKHFVCSVAAGPALEGGGAACGMRAVEGAVDKVSFSGSFPMADLICHVIGEGEPIGICGSGLLDTLAVLLDLHLVDETGYLRSRKEAEDCGVSKKIASRIEESTTGRRILLMKGKKPIYFYAQDIRQLQTAIGAIRAGIEILLEKACIKKEEVEEIYLAGTFGSYLSVKSCMDVGLLPKMDEKKVIKAGNLAGVGAAMGLLSLETISAMEEKVKNLNHVELAGDKRFEELFIQYMNFST